MIAIALSCEPRLILCDEPTTALDVTIQDQILKLLLNLREELGMSVVFVTHDLAVVAQTCQSLAVMYAGQVVEAGTVHDVFHQPRHPYTLGLLRSVPDADDVRESLRFDTRQPARPGVAAARLPLRSTLRLCRESTAPSATSPCSRSMTAASARASTRTSALPLCASSR